MDPRWEQLTTAVRVQLRALDQFIFYAALQQTTPSQCHTVADGLEELASTVREHADQLSARSVSEDA
jgi:hypothetical protein